MFRNHLSNYWGPRLVLPIPTDFLSRKEWWTMKVKVKLGAYSMAVRGSSAHFFLGPWNLCGWGIGGEPDAGPVWHPGYHSFSYSRFHQVSIHWSSWRKDELLGGVHDDCQEKPGPLNHGGDMKDINESLTRHNVSTVAQFYVLLHRDHKHSEDWV